MNTIDTRENDQLLLERFNTEVPIELQTVVHSGLSALRDRFTEEELIQLMPILLWQVEGSRQANYANELNGRMSTGTHPSESVEDTMTRGRMESVRRMFEALKTKPS